MYAPAEAGRLNVIGFGAGSLDILEKPGVIRQPHLPGETISWDAGCDSRLEELRQNGGYKDLLHVGGDVINVLARLALVSGTQTGFVGVLGRDDPATVAIGQNLDRFGIMDLAVHSDNYQPGIHFIERGEEPAADRMVRRPERQLEDRYLMREYTRTILAAANIAVVASVKSSTVVRNIFTDAPRSAKISYNPGSSGFKPESGTLDMMRERKPDLLAANIMELRQLLRQPDMRVQDLALLATDYALNVLITHGNKGTYWAHNSQVSHQPCTELEKWQIIDTLGAGDAAHAAGIESRLIRGDDPEVSLRHIDEISTQVIQVIGGHGYLYDRVRPVTFSLSQRAPALR